ncbi:MAG: RNA methyltransferase [Bacteroidetes bacterium HGW-Bacteroidetes-21]|jgi:putative N6-adenine-specific DNA methylase|nr:MAG: RNA methyltransferase [Bacteroidetes bacterium HGW-Bacteroidetes-21]
MTFPLVATTLYGLEEVLARELSEIGASDIVMLNRAVKYRGDLAVLYKSNLYLRTALKVLKPIAEFKARNEQELYDGVKQIKWDEFISPHHTIAVDGTTYSDTFKHSKYVALKTKDAIVDQFREKFNVRPSVDVDNPDLQVNMHIAEILCTVSLDSSGSHLGKRGYRQEQVLAPISETMAAGIILLSEWDKKSDFLDPMCGSGTFPIEAAMIATNTAPGNLRHFAFEKWKDFDPALWKSIKEESEKRVIPFTGKISGRDSDEMAVRISRNNAARAGVNSIVKFEINDFFKNEAQTENCLIVMNPPYGERLNEEDEMIPFYKEIGTKLKHFYMGCDAWIISGNTDAIKFVGLKPSRKLRLFNGPIECKLHKFQMYRGSKRGGNEI